ncbi:MAG: hypothetical protein IMZ46_00135 [Acidobacteria bacterium]|nr:hypothetical protein [Acidobacteriota bacterium]
MEDYSPCVWPGVHDEALIFPKSTRESPRAIDLTIIDEKGLELDMGTTFDYFGDLAQPRWENAFLKKGVLTANQVLNRRLLRKVMTEAGFISIPSEWWHYDAFPAAEVRKRFKLIE